MVNLPWYYYYYTTQHEQQRQISPHSCLIVFHFSIYEERVRTKITSVYDFHNVTNLV
jgi:hypothetical protein